MSDKPYTRNSEKALADSTKMIDLIMTPESDLAQKDREWVAKSVSKNFGSAG